MIPPAKVLALPQPLYTQIKNELRQRILDGSYQPHQQLPSENELIRHFGVSRITVRQALGDLQQEGLIFRIHGKGSFVSKPKAFQELHQLQGFGEAMAKMGFETFNRVISLRTLVPTPAVAERLRLHADDPVVEIRRVRFLNREPISLDVSYFAQDLGERLGRADLARRDIFSLLENEFNLPLGMAELRVEAILADPQLSEHLQVPEGSPILRLERITHTADGLPIDFEYLYYRGDAFQYRLRIERSPHKTREEPR